MNPQYENGLDKYAVLRANVDGESKLRNAEFSDFMRTGSSARNMQKRNKP
jgi:hypothetical protein